MWTRSSFRRLASATWPSTPSPLKSGSRLDAGCVRSAIDILERAIRHIHLDWETPYPSRRGRQFRPRPREARMRPQTARPRDHLDSLGTTLHSILFVFGICTAGATWKDTQDPRGAGDQWAIGRDSGLTPRAREWRATHARQPRGGTGATGGCPGGVARDQGGQWLCGRLRRVADRSRGMSSATVTRDLIVAHTRALKMPGIARVFEGLARQARDAHWPH